MKKREDQKAQALRKLGCLHPRAQQVIDDLFRDSKFFDSRDLIQVKYEMLRRVQVDGRPIRQVAGQFGFSRPSIYKALAAFQTGGLAGLMRIKPGPRRSHKLSEAVMQFIQEERSRGGAVPLQDLVKRIKRRFGLVVHLRSIQRSLRRMEKKTQ